MTDDYIVVAVLRLKDDIAPPAEHREQNAGDPDGQQRRAYFRPPDRLIVHEHDETKRRQKREGRADDRPRARLDEMETRPVRNCRVSHCLLPSPVIPPAPRDRQGSLAKASQTARRTACRIT